MDVAEMGLRIDSSQAKEATTALEGFTEASVKAEAATKRFQRVEAEGYADRRAARQAIKDQAAAYQALQQQQAALQPRVDAYVALQGQGAQAARDATAATAAMKEQVSLTGVASDHAGVSLGKMENAVRGLGLSAVGVEGPIGKIVETLATLGIGGTVVTAVLAATAAIAVAYSKMTQDFENLIPEAERVADLMSGQMATGMGDAYRNASLLAGGMEKVNEKTATFWSINPVENWQAFKDYWNGFSEADAQMTRFANALGQVFSQHQKLVNDRSIGAFGDQLTALKQAQGDYFDGGGIDQLHRMAAELKAFADSTNLTVQQQRAAADALQQIRAALAGQAQKGIATEGPTSGFMAGFQADQIQNIQRALTSLQPILQWYAHPPDRNTIFKDLTQQGQTAAETVRLVNAALAQGAAPLFMMQGQGIGQSGSGERSAGEDAKLAADNWALAARAIVAAGQASGELSDSTALLLQNLVSVVDQAEKVANALADTGKAASTGDWLALAANAAGLLTSIFGGGESPESRRAREIVEKNIAAIQANTDALTIQASGAAMQQGRQSIQALLGAGLDSFNYGQTVTEGIAGRILAEQGTSLQQLEDLAKSVGITLNTDSSRAFIDSLKALDEQFRKLEKAHFADTFAGQMQLLTASFTVFNVTDPLEKLRQTINVLNQVGVKGFTGFDSAGRPISTPDHLGVGSPALAAAFQGLDVSRAADRAQALQNLQDLFRQIQAGTFDTTQTGGLTLQQFVDQITNTIQLLGQVEDAAKARDDALQATVDNLKKFQDSLKLSDLSTLSPVQQLEEARRQYQAVLAQAQAGDQAAAAQLPDAARTFLSASRSVNASGPAFAADFAAVMAQTEALARMFESQQSTADATLEATQSTASNTKQTVEQLQALVALQADANQRLIDKVDDLTVQMAEMTRVTKQGFEANAL